MLMFSVFSLTVTVTDKADCSLIQGVILHNIVTVSPPL